MASTLVTALVHGWMRKYMEHVRDVNSVHIFCPAVRLCLYLYLEIRTNSGWLGNC